MATSPDRCIPIVEERDIVLARQAGREVARELGFGAADQTRLATAISELTRNVLKYADSGLCEVTSRREVFTHHVQVIVSDAGPGIPDIEAALGEGFTTGRGLGMGLPGTKRLVDDFQVVSRPGETKVTVAMSRTLAANARDSTWKAQPATRVRPPPPPSAPS